MVEAVVVTGRDQMKRSLNLDHIRLRNKFLMLYMFCVLIPIVITNIVFYTVTTENVRKQRMRDISRALEQIKNEFRMETEDAVSVSYVLLQDYNLNNLLVSEYEQPAEYVAAYDSYTRRMLNSYTPVYTSVQNIRIYLNNPTMLHSGAIGYLSDEVLRSRWYEAVMAEPANIVLIRTARENDYVYRDRETRDTFSIVRRMNYYPDSKWEKILKIELRMPVVHQVFRNLNVNGQVYLLNEQGIVEYTTDPNIPWETSQVPYRNLIHPDDWVEFETAYEDVQYLRGWKLVGIVSPDNVFQEVYKSRAFVFWMASLNLLFSTVIIFWITRSLNIRLVNILRHMKKVKHQQFVTIKGGETRDEIGQLTGEFNRMTMQIKSLIDDVYIAEIQTKSLEIERRKAQLNALQSQINPHFLFNALETIRMRSLIKKESETAHIIHNMARLFRSSLTWKKDRITVAEEVEFMTWFLQIQQYRFGKRLTYHLNIDPDARDVIMPKMVFLPFVENASIHGIEPLKQGGNIDIQFCRTGDALVFMIRDDGVGMDEEQVRKIVHYLKVEDELGERIGIQNSIYRLQMLYGEDFRLHIDSAPGAGTMIEITIPIIS